MPADGWPFEDFDLQPVDLSSNLTRYGAVIESDLQTRKAEVPSRTADVALGMTALKLRIYR